MTGFDCECSITTLRSAEGTTARYASAMNPLRLRYRQPSTCRWTERHHHTIGAAGTWRGWRSDALLVKHLGARAELIDEGQPLDR